MKLTPFTLLWLAPALFAGTQQPVPMPSRPALRLMPAPAAPAPAPQDPTTAAPPAATPQDPQAAAAAAATAAQQAQQEQQKQQRQQKLQQARFDRRPSAILTTWSTPVVPEPPAANPVTAPTTAPTTGTETPATGPTSAPNSAPTSAPTSATTSAPISATTSAPISAPAAAPTPETPVETPTSPGTASGADATAPATPPKDPFDLAIAKWQRDVTLGDWPAVKAFLGTLQNDAEKKFAYQHMLDQLRQPPPQQQQQQQQQQQGGAFAERHQFTFDDVIGLAGCAPLPLDDPMLAALGALTRAALDRGALLPPLLARLQAEHRKAEGERALDRRQAAKLLMAAELRIESGEFLPDVDAAVAAKDHEALNLLAASLLARHAKEPKQGFLEQAWAALQAIFASSEIDKKQKDAALTAAVGIAPKVRAELGQQWLRESFTRDPQRGMDIVASIGRAAALPPNPTDIDFRQKALELAATAVEALLQAAPERAAEWHRQLDLLAANWLREAQLSQTYDQSSSFGPIMQRDRYGNFFYFDEQEYVNRYNRGGIRSLKTADVLDLQPSNRWLQFVDPALRPKYAMVAAQLWLKVHEEGKAFPNIELLAKDYPKEAKELVHEFLRVWTTNHDPNGNRSRNAYWMYGYEPRAESIPLTRSKQDRNLADLGEWIARIKTLGLGDPDEELLTRAFTTCHSAAEVYRMDAIEKVFGGMGAMKAQTLAQLAQQMRANLLTIWRRPDVQERAKTRRKKADIESEVLQGYAVASGVVDKALAQYPGHWALLLVQAALAHDLNNFMADSKNDAEFSERRGEAFALFQASADSYLQLLPQLDVSEESTLAYEHWFYAALGASDLAAVTEETAPRNGEIRRIAEHIRSLPGAAAERHLARFANNLFTRMGAARPQIKFRYLQAGFEIVGDHKSAYEARKVFDYYRDLVTEIRLQAQIDGSDRVGDQPFGVLVSLVHTREIEREAGGFSRYLQNQNSMNYSYNYGRPTENYRDKFAEAARDALKETFEVLSVTFQQEGVQSKALAQYGWRQTPYAYLLLKARGPQVDKLPALRFDLDFLDTSGYAVLPVESAPVPIDARATDGPRPFENVEITQILDERQAASGKLILEVKATGRGLLPPLEHLLDLAPGGFEIAKQDDGGISVARFDPDRDSAVQTERTWMIQFKGKEGQAELPRTFTFGRGKGPEHRLLRQRYADADLVAAAEVADLEANYGSKRTWWPWLIAALVAAAAATTWFVRRPRGDGTALHTPFTLPASLDPFSVLALLRDIEQRAGLDDEQRRELQQTIARIEAGYFAAGGPDAPDLRQVASTWVSKAVARAAG